MELYQAVVLAVIQGLTEFLPVSSSGHLLLPSNLLGWPDQGLAFDVAVHLGSLLAVMAYFRTEIAAMVTGWLSDPLLRRGDEDARLSWLVVVATLPAVFFGLVFGGVIETELRGIEVLATTTIVFGLLLGLADWRGKRMKPLAALGIKAALVIGLAQAVALIPGTSRSGITITAALFLGFDRQASARFSFLLSIPLILAAGSLKGVELLGTSQAVDWMAMGVGVAVSGLTAYACIHWFLKLLDTLGMQPFVIYRLLLGTLLFALA